MCSDICTAVKSGMCCGIWSDFGADMCSDICFSYLPCHQRNIKEVFIYIYIGILSECFSLAFYSSGDFLEF